MVMEQRSQAILRLPKDQTPAEVTLHDGERSYVILFVPPGFSIAHLLDDDSWFIPMNFTGITKLVARGAIASLSIHAMLTEDDGLPQERQRAVIRMRNGETVNGEIRWIAPPDRRRTLDCLNDGGKFLAVYEGDYITFVAKAHIATVEEA